MMMEYGSFMDRPPPTPSPPPPPPSPGRRDDLPHREDHSPGTPVSSASSPSSPGCGGHQNLVTTAVLGGIPIVCLHMDGKERLCLAQISNTLLKDYSYNEIHNRRVALGITCVQCTPVQLEILRRAGAMPVSSRRCGMITKREAERLVKSFLEDHSPPQLPDNFAFNVAHTCGWGCKGQFIPSRYNSSRAKCIKCCYCAMFFSPNKFIFHFHRMPDAKYRHPDAANFNSWRRHLCLDYRPASDELEHAWEDVKAMFNGGSRKRVGANEHSPKHEHEMMMDSGRDGGMMLQSPGPQQTSSSSQQSPPTSSHSHHAPSANKRQRNSVASHTDHHTEMSASSTGPMNHQQTPFSFPPGPFINNPVNPGAQFLNPGARQHHHHPALPFYATQGMMGSAGGAGGHPTGQELVPAGGGMDKMNFADMWKVNKPPPVMAAAAAAYCHPFNILWAKNLANFDPFRGVFDPELMAAAAAGAGAESKSRDHNDVMKGSGQGQAYSDKNNRFSAFKPVGMFGGSGSGCGDARIEEVVNSVLEDGRGPDMGSGADTSLLSATSSSPLSDDDDDGEPDIDVTDDVEGEDDKTIDDKTTAQQPTTSTSSFSSNTAHITHQQQSASLETSHDNNNDVIIKMADPMTGSCAGVGESVTSSCPGHVTAKSGNAKNFSVEFLACTDNNNKTEDTTTLPQASSSSSSSSSSSPADKVCSPEAERTSSPSVPCSANADDMDLSNIYNMSKEQLQSELIEILAKRDRLEKSVQFMKEAKTHSQTSNGPSSTDTLESTTSTATLI